MTVGQLVVLFTEDALGCWRKICAAG